MSVKDGDVSPKSNDGASRKKQGRQGAWLAIHCSVRQYKSTDEQPLPRVRINATQIEQVILNFLRNARDAMKAAGHAGQIRVMAQRSAPGELQVSVLDQGPGIDPQLQNRMFEPFVTSKSAGIGIGLSICQSIVEAHGGRVCGFNHSEGGACFQLTLPLTE
jgi:signal transduction histidine kinase